jgi:hypothetical protein
MKIVEDAPGARLLLEEKTVSMPEEAGYPIAFVVSLFFLVPAGLIWYTGSLFPLLFMFGAAVVFTQMWRSIRRNLSAVDVNGPAGEIRISWCRLMGGEIEDEHFPLADLESLRVSLVAGGRGGVAGVRIDLKTRKGSTHNVGFSVDSMNRHEEVADFALRIGAAARLPTNRVVRNDPRDFEMEFSRGPVKEAPEPPPAPAPPAIRADYAKGAVAPEARLAVVEEKAVAFTPPAEFGRYRLDEWNPGTRVVFHQPTDVMLIVLMLPLASLILLGPAAYIATRQGFIHADPGSELVMSIIPSVIGIFVGGLAFKGLWSARSETVVIDWSSGSVTPGDGLRPAEIPLSEVIGLDLVCVRSGDGGSSNVKNYSYCCVLKLRTREAGEEGVRSLVESDDADDPDVPYRASLPLATALAKALGVKRRVRDYDGKILD